MMSVSEIIALILTCMIMQIIFVLNYGNMSNNKTEKNTTYIITIIITSLLIFINNYFNILSFRLITGLFINCLTVYLIYKDKIKYVIFYSIVHAIISLILELLLSPILMFRFDNVELFNNMVVIKIGFSILSAIITIFIFKNKKLLNFIEKVKKIITDKNNFIITIIILLLILNMMGVARAIKTSDIFLITITLVCVLFMLTTIKIIITDKYNMTILNETTKNIKENIKAYSKTIDDCRELKHNLRNDLLTLKSSIEKNSQDKINEIIIKYNTNYEWINMIDDIPEGLQGLIYLKQKESEIKKVKLYVNIVKNYNTNNKDYIDLCSTLGILIDNAIEASNKTKSKVIEINFKESGKDLHIKICNIFNNDVDVNKIGNKNYSTKEYKSGLGLNFVKKINNPKIKVNFKIINNLFITDILYSIKN